MILFFSIFLIWADSFFLSVHVLRCCDVQGANGAATRIQRRKMSSAFWGAGQIAFWGVSGREVRFRVGKKLNSFAISARKRIFALENVSNCATGENALRYSLSLKFGRNLI